ncbi:PHP domain-containing protein [Brevibacillus brevis]|uniref:Histidinol-phosphatase n=1 Tax=Brevibacillus brevis TaxID=1393 RepID=A0ABY9T2P0_BREBE|nr:PHP domain-containing protein [Brevibacillus brevis]WNC13491.1 PHP domain-containing protein [Brevibacillus brevis]
MKADFHVRLEEGPYSLEWLNRTAESLQAAHRQDEGQGRREWAEEMVGRLAVRLQKGPFSREWLDLYLRQAKKAGLQEVCIAEHLYRFSEGKPYYEKHLHLGGDQAGRAQRRWLEQVAVDSLSDYVAFLREERPRWEEAGVALRIGLELDYFPGGEADLACFIEQGPWDVCIGAVKFPKGLGLIVADSRERLKRMERSVLYSHYFDWLEQAVQSGLFDLLAYDDGLQSFGFMRDETALLPYYQRIARALRRRDVAAELPTSLLASTPQRGGSPSGRWLEILAHHEVPVTVASRACYPEQVGQHWAEACATLKRAGYCGVVLFADRKRRLAAFA